MPCASVIPGATILPPPEPDRSSRYPQRDLPPGWTHGAQVDIVCGMYIFITVLLGLMICGFGAGFAFACRMDPEQNRD